jgi:hypothetical protein
MPSLVQDLEEQVLAEITKGDDVRRQVEEMRLMAEISKALVLKHKNEYEKPYEKNLEYFPN